MPDSPYIVEVTKENFETVILHGSMETPVLVDFWADWCQPCQTLMPILAKLADEYQGAFILAKICLLYTSPSPRDGLLSRMPSSA